MGRFFKKVSKIFAIFLFIVLILGCGYLYWSYQLEDDKIWSPYVINDISIQGMTKDEALQAIEDEFKKDYQDSIISIEFADKTYEINVFSMLDIDVKEIIDGAYLTGHGKWYKRGYEKWMLQKNENSTIEYQIIPDASNTTAISSLIEETKIQNVDTHEETSWELTDHSLILYKGRKGVVADLEGLEEMILGLMNDKTYKTTLEAPVIEIEPDSIDFQEIEDEIHIDPQDAQFNDKFEVIHEIEGVSFNVTEAKKIFNDTKEGSEVVIDFVYTKPEITKEDLESLIFRDELSSFQTYGSGTSQRINNIALAAKSCEDVILLPGDEFSYNETLGERTAQRGYQSAGVFINGQLSSGIGGGICQVSSTIFAALLKTDLQIVERHNHSLAVSYLERGYDATVSWGLLDFRFRNNLDYPVKLSVTYNNGIIDVKLTGTKTDDLRIENSTKYAGGAIKTYRDYYDINGNLVKSVEVATSRYK